MLSIDSQRPMELAAVVGFGGLALSTLGALATFVGFVAQVGIARRSAAVSRGVGRMTVAVAVCTISLLSIAILYTMFSELTTPANYRGGQYYPQHEGFYRFTTVILFPMALAAMLILYHRLLAAGRRAVAGELPDRFDG